ncbi:MAG: class I SAM-dependent methyltransferase [Promethearchaeota archaeon]|jgi:tRNA wybutosine-synthesizing protein 2
MSFKRKLKDQLLDVLTEKELSLLPRGFQTIGNLVILKLNPELYSRKNVIAEAFMVLLPRITGVYINKGRIVGTYREPENIEFIAGVDDPVVQHKEHGVIYQFDITKIMFSKGNINERKFLATLVKEGEIIVDMFAGIGYFSLPIAKHSKAEKIYAIELNSESFKYLSINTEINHLENVIQPINGNCKEEVIKLSNLGIKADRVIMGVFPAPLDYVNIALKLVKEGGTMFHFEGVIGKDEHDSLFEDFRNIAKESSYKCELQSYRYVKSYGPRLFHIVLDIFVKKN